MTKKTYKISGMDCKACATMIELDLEDVGVTAKCDFDNQKLEVTFDPQKVKEQSVKETIQKAGYSVG